MKSNPQKPFTTDHPAHIGPAMGCHMSLGSNCSAFSYSQKNDEKMRGQPLVGEIQNRLKQPGIYKSTRESLRMGKFPFQFSKWGLENVVDTRG